MRVHKSRNNRIYLVEHLSNRMHSIMTFLVLKAFNSHRFNNKLIMIHLGSHSQHLSSKCNKCLNSKNSSNNSKFKSNKNLNLFLISLDFTQIKVAIWDGINSNNSKWWCSRWWWEVINIKLWEIWEWEEWMLWAVWTLIWWEVILNNRWTDNFSNSNLTLVSSIHQQCHNNNSNNHSNKINSTNNKWELTCMQVVWEWIQELACNNSNLQLKCKRTNLIMPRHLICSIEVKVVYKCENEVIHL